MEGRDFFLWQVRSFTIRVDLKLVDELNRCLTNPGLRPGMELGGILVGRTLSPFEIEVSDFEFVPSEHRRGIAYSLGFREQSSLAGRVAKLSRKAATTPVGFFRTHLRKGLFLDQDDFTLMQEVFTEPSQIALLIRPTEPGPWNAGFFVREDGDIDRRQSSLLFPFDSETLRIQGPIVTEIPVAARPIAPTPSRMSVIPSRKMGWAAAAVAGTLVLSAELSKVAVHRPSPAPPSQPPVARVEPVAPQPPPVLEPPQPYVEPPTPDPTPDDGSTEPPLSPPKAQPTVKPSPYVAPSPFVVPRPAQPKTEAKVIPIPTPPPEVAPTPAPPAPQPEPARPPAPKPAVQVAVSFEAPRSSELKRVVSHVPLFGRLTHAEGGRDFSPARPDGPLALRVPASMAFDLEGGVAVDLRLTVDKDGSIRNSEVLHGAGTDFA